MVVSDARTASHSRYLSRTYRTRADREDDLVVRLTDLGSLGVEVREAGDEAELVAWFDAMPDEDPRLPHRPGQERGGVRLLAEAWSGDEDWLAEYRRHAAPREIGRGFLVDPREPDDARAAPADAAGRVVLLLPAREAFGTGSHASTRLVMAWLEELPVPGARVLDVGCGSGILSFGASALGASRVVGFDFDRVSALMAGQNARRNPTAWVPGSIRGGFYAGGVAALAPASFDLALVNVLPHRVADDVPAIAARIAVGGLAVVSGLLVEEVDEVAENWESRGMRLRTKRVEDEWAALLLEKRS